VAQLTTDGIQQSFEWVNVHAPDHAVVRTYVHAKHIVGALSAAPREGVTDAERAVRLAPYDRDRLIQHFERVYSVDRAFGLEVAAVWRHRADGDRPAAMLTP